VENRRKFTITVEQCSNILASHHRLACWTAMLPREIQKRKILAGGIDMSVTWTANLDPKIIALVDTAFDKSWQFVRTDPELAHRDVREMRASLTESLTRLAQNGERDVWRLANGAIGQLRRQRSAA
jgi:sigma54-dependent transcription regulator